MKYQIDKDF